MDVWNELSPELQQIMLDAAPEAQENALLAMKEYDDWANQEMVRLGAKTYRITTGGLAQFYKARDVLVNEFAAKGADFESMVNIWRES